MNLDPCSHCGNSSIRLADFYMREKENKIWQAYCEECRLASPTALSEGDAVAAWNRLGSIIRSAKSTGIDLPGGGPLNINIYIRDVV